MARSGVWKPKTKTWGRSYHETRAAEDVGYVERTLVSAHSCDSGSFYALAKANRAIAGARVHLAAIGPGGEGPRTRKLWGVVGRMDARVNAANNRMAKCLLR